MKDGKSLVKKSGNQKKSNGKQKGNLKIHPHSLLH